MKFLTDYIFRTSLPTRWLLGLMALFPALEASTQCAAPGAAVTYNPAPVGGGICYGTATTITAPSACGSCTFAYQWYSGTSPSGTIIPTATNQTLNLASGDVIGAGLQYYVNITCTDATAVSPTYTVPAVIPVNPLPPFTVSLSDIAICENETMTLNAECTNIAGGCNSTAANMSYTWSAGNFGTPSLSSPTTTGTNQTTLTPSMSGTGTITFTVVGTNTATGCSQTVTTPTLAVHDAPALSGISLEYPSSPANTTITSFGTIPDICENMAITLTAASGCAGCTYEWDIDPTTGANQNSTSNPFVPTPLGSDFQVTYTVVEGVSGLACYDDDVFSVNVNNLPDNFTISPASPEFCAGTTLGMSITPGMGQPGVVTYTWSGITPATGTTNTLSSSTPGVTAVSVLATDGNSPACTAEQTVNVTVHANPTITLASNFTDVCSGSSSVNLSYSCLPATSVCTANAAAMTAYQWNGDSPSLDGSASGSQTPASTNTYFLTFTNTKNCVGTDDIQVSVHATPTITFPASPTAVCANTSVPLDVTVTSVGSTATSYTWSISANSVTTEDATIIASSTRDYSISVTHSYPSINCSATASKSITANPLPTVQLPDVTTCTGNTFSYAPSSSGTSLSYDWSDGSTTSSISINTGAISAQQTHVVTVTDINACEASDTGRVNIIMCGQEQITHSPNYCKGDTIHMTVIGADPAATYEWLPDHEVTPAITITPASTDLSVTRTVKIRVNGTLIRTLTETITFNDPNPVITGSDTICFQDIETLTVSSCGGCNTYAWTPESNPTSGTALGAPAGIQYSHEPGVPGTTETYMLEAIDGNGCRDTAFYDVYVRKLPDPNITPAGTAFFCPEGSVLLDANPTFCPSCTYQWSNGATTQTINTNTATTYTVTVTQSGCADTDMVITEAYPSPTVQIENSAGTVLPSPPANPYLVLCDGQPDTLTATGCAGCSFQWNTGSTTPSIIATTAPGMYYVSVVDVNGCMAYSDPVIAINSTTGNNSVATANPSIICNGNAANLSVTACVGCTYEWFEIGVGTPIATTRTTSVTTAGTYYAVVTNAQGCDFETNTLAITVLASTPPPIYSSVSALCSGDTVKLSTVNNPAYGYQWYESGNIISAATDSVYYTTTTGTYSVEVTYPNTCVVSSVDKTIPVGAFTAQLYPNTVSAIIVCDGDSAQISTDFFPGYTYQWYRDGIAIAGATGSALFVQDEGDYYVAVTTDYNCRSITNRLAVSKSILSDASVTINDYTICPGDSTRIRAALCVGCTYEWYRGNSPVVPADTNSFYYAKTGGDYYAIISNSDGCQISSDTVTITVEGVFFPSLNSSAPIICNGVTPVLTTAYCAGCDYVWMLNSAPIQSALNDSTYTVPALFGVTDQYSVEVTYPTGCRDTSNVVSIGDGTFQLSASVVGAALPIVCNGDPVPLIATDSSGVCPGGGCLYEWFFNGLPVYQSGTNTFNADSITSGGYSVQITHPNGCYELSDTVYIPAINFSPVLTSDATAICGTSVVTLDVSTCTPCTYQWFKGYTTALTGTNALPTYITGVAGIYTAEVNQNGCKATSNPITLNTLSGLDTAIVASSTSICDGQAITLSRVAGNCSGCTYQWLLNGVPVPAATLYTYTTNVEGDYSLIVAQSANGCEDTSAITTISEILAMPGFALDFATPNLTPVALTGANINLYDGLSPAILTTPGTNNGTFSNSPLSALGSATLFNAPYFNVFDPDTSGSGFHQITFSYDSLGCTFTATDVIFVLDEPAVEILNWNIQADQYEACISDTLEIILTNIPFQIFNVYAFNQQDIYTPLNIISSSPTPMTYNNATLYNDTIVVVIEEWTKESYFKLEGASPTDTMLTPYVLVHNADLTFAGLPSTICSNGSQIDLVANPSGGYFTATYTNGSAVSGGAVSGTSIYPSLLNPAMYVNDAMPVKVIYNYPFTYTNGNACPLVDTFSRTTTARSVFLNDIQYNFIATSQTQELLTNLVYAVTPYTATPSQWQHGYSFSGSFTDPVGAPVNFLPANAGIGNHPMTYTIYNGICSNAVTDNIKVVAPPTPLAIADTICRTNAPVAFNRDALYAYFAFPPMFLAPGVIYNDTINILSVSSTNNSQGIVVVNPSLGLEQYLYDPALVTGNFDTINITYSFGRVETVAGLPFDTINYVVGSISLPILIEDTVSVEILDTIVQSVYCEEDINYLLAADTTGGFFELMGGSGQYASGDTVDFAIFNPFDIHGNESSDVSYVLTYTLEGLICRSQDTMHILIPEPLNPSFYTATGKDAYCDSEPADTVVVATPGGVWLVGGVAQSELLFDAYGLDPGIYVTTYQVADVWGCSVEASDTFEIYPLPNVYFSMVNNPAASFESSYCTNDSSFYFEVHPAPICYQSIGSGTIIVDEGFENPLFPPNGWQRYNINPSGANWELSNFNSNTGNNNAFVNVSSNQQNTWLITTPINMTVGNVYRLQYYVRAGSQNCPTCADASMKVSVVQGTSLLAHQNLGTVLFDAPAMTNETYIPVVHDYICGTSGVYTFAFNNYSSANLARSLRIDDVSITEISSSSCVDGGIGAIFGPGITYAGDSTYLFEPATLTPANIEVKYVFINTNGCLDSANAPITIYQHVTPVISGLDPSYCVNSPTDTLSVTPNDGGSTSGFSVLPIPSTGTVTTNLQQFPKPFYDPNTPTSGEVIQYVYVDPATGCRDIDLDTVVVLDMPDTLTYKNLDPGYCRLDSAVILDTTLLAGSPLAGIFYGYGVIDGASGPGVATFSPDLAATVMGHTGDVLLTYIYPLANGCVDTLRQTTRVHAMPDLTFTNMPDSICLNNDPYLIVVNNHAVSGSAGQIVQNILLAPNAGLFTGAVMNANDSIVPQQVTAGSYPVSFTYTDANGCTSAIYDTVRVDTVPVIYFTYSPEAPDSIFCELNDPGTLLLAYPPYYPGSGYLDFGVQSFNQSFYQIDPLALATYPTNALYPIFYTYTDLHGCTGTGTDSIEVRPYPRIDLSLLPTTYCDTDDTTYFNLMDYTTPVGGNFTDNLPVTSIYQDSLLALHMPAGVRTLVYYFMDTVTGCYNTDTLTISVYNTPSIGFEMFGGCVGETITFVGEAIDMESGLDTISNVVWNFGDAQSASYTPTNPIEVGDTTHTYASNGIYTVELQVTNQGLCTSTLQQQLIISPTINNYPYSEDFETSDGGWYADHPINIASDIWGRTPFVSDHINDPTNTGWKTAPAAPYTYQGNDNGWVLSPCFDLRPLTRPMISLDIWRDMNPGIDGAVMEYYDPYTSAWRTLGQARRGIHWYEGEIILSRPGNQANATLPTGWTDVTEETEEWESARYRLDDLMYRNFVRLRIAFSAFNTTNTENYEGMAFDNVWVGNRTRNVLVEHFSNYAYDNVDDVDQYVYDLIFNVNYGRDVMLIQYQTAVNVSNDSINRLNTEGPSTRVTTYGISDNNQAIVDGTPRGTGVSDELTTYELDYDMLQFPAFDIQINQMDIIGNTINTSATITALQDMPEAPYAIFTTIIEDTVYNPNPQQNPQHQMNAIFRTFLPDEGGEDHERDWSVGESVTSTHSWVSNTGTGTFNDASNLNLVVFIQNMDNESEEIYQAVSTRNINIYFPEDTVTSVQPLPTSLADFPITQLKLYPNPSTDYFNVEFKEPLEGQCPWRLVDQWGRVIHSGKAVPGTKMFTIDTYDLPAGSYFFIINDGKVLAQRQIVIARP